MFPSWLNQSQGEMYITLDHTAGGVAGVLRFLLRNAKRALLDLAYRRVRGISRSYPLDSNPSGGDVDEALFWR